MDLLLASLVALGLGPVVVRRFGDRGAVVAGLDGFVLVMLSGLVLMLILPHSLSVAGWWALPAAGLGLAAPTFFERLPFLSRSVADRHAMVMLPALAGLALHAFADGAALTTHATEHAGAPEDFLALGVVVHRIPLGLIIWSRAGVRAGLVLLLWMAVATVFGFFAGGAGLALLSLDGVALFQAFVAGSLLHVALASPVHAGAPLPASPRFAPGVGALLAAGFLVLLARLHPVEPGGFGLIGKVGETFLHLALESAPALVVGFTGAGVLQAVLRSHSARWLAARTRPLEALKGMTFGLPLPLCSCSVLPVYRTLVGSGAPVPGAVAFLIATPEIGLDAFFLSLPLLGVDLALTRLAAAAFVAFAAAMVLATLVGRGSLAMQPLPVEGLPADERAGSFAGRIRAGLRFGLGELFDHTMPWILLGLGVAALLAPWLEGEWLARLPWGVDVLALAVLGVPGYVCASGATPMVAILIAGGLSPGAAIAFLITGPATNVTTIGVLATLHGRSFAVAFAAVVPALAIALGLAVNLLMGDTGAGPAVDADHESGWLQWGCLAALGILLVSSLVRRGPRGLLAEIVPALDDGHVHDDCDDCDAPEPPLEVR